MPTHDSIKQVQFQATVQEASSADGVQPAQSSGGDQRVRAWLFESISACLLLVVAASWLFFGTYDLGVRLTAEDGGYVVVAQVKPKLQASKVTQAQFVPSEILPTRQVAPTSTSTVIPRIGTETPEVPLVPTPITGATPVDYLAKARDMLEAAKMGRDERMAHDALETLAKIDRSLAVVDSQARALESQIYYMLDILHGTTYLGEGNSVRWHLLDSKGQLLTNPLDFTVHGGYLFVVDSGTLYQGALADLRSSEESLRLSLILTPTATVGGYPVKEIVAVEGMNTSGAVFVLDKSNWTLAILG